MDIQRIIGGDIIMAFDECPPYPSDYAYAKKSMELTHRWLDRCFERFNNTPDKYGYTQNLFPIVQGSTYKDLRTVSAEYIASKNATGNAIGGLSVGEPTEVMYEFTELCCDILPMQKPRYLMGVGTPWNILENIALGIDMFDCVMPTRNGRNAMLFTSNGVINIDNKKWEKDFSAIDEGIDCEISNYYSKAYLRHLMKAKEYLGYMSNSGQTDSSSVYYYNSFDEKVTVQPKDQKSIAIIHYTNQSIDFFYGEKFALEPYDPTAPANTSGQARNFRLHIPWLMWHKNPECCLGETFWVDPPGYDGLN
jgi:tRNA-guanine transglycosylase